MSSETTRTIKYSPVADTLRFINRLQQAATPTDSSILRYNNLILGEASKANTRPFILYLPNGEPFKLATLPDSGLQSASLFRVEDVNENSATISIDNLMNKVEEIPISSIEGIRILHM